ncbi:glycoside hydrolase family 71 protein [Trichocladium antarcticum]|uniref:Glycoside hydrolase family 71 protein n=1 Tax=Trichocladium antarcticum TaxID=1450529 RepID=A0AAN6ZBC0_9PEZI|nr:glycoside hydrolase family 71 protein [Trichocladium antarcticum]
MAILVVLLPVRADREVFAHVIVGNTAELELADWEDDMRLAQAATIDAFALNIAAQDPNNGRSLDLAFQAANKLQFKLFFSFDYLAQGPWAPDQVTALLARFAPNAAYFKHDGTRPFVSTFEGPGRAADWPAIKHASNAFFVPDWSSADPQTAVHLAGGVADGLFSFDAWPAGDTNMTTAGDGAFAAALAPAAKAYMMPVAPWFFTNLPALGKNWLWRGDGLWDRRWGQIAAVRPRFVQILSWNDYGESHYIGPVRAKALGLFAAAGAPADFARGMSHDGWRKLLPFYIAQYKMAGVDGTGLVVAGVDEAVAAYYRPAPALACPSGGTTGNNAAFGEAVVAPEALVEDSVFYAALLNSDEGVAVTVAIGGMVVTGGFARVPAAGRGTPGVYMGSVPFGGNTGDVVVTVARAGREVARADGGRAISTECWGNAQNWNAVAI